MVRRAMSDHWTQLPFCDLRHLPLTLRKARWTMWRLRTNACQCSTRGLSLLVESDFGAKSNLEVDDMNSPYWFCLSRFDSQCDVVVYCYIEYIIGLYVYYVYIILYIYHYSSMCSWHCALNPKFDDKIRFRICLNGHRWPSKELKSVET